MDDFNSGNSPPNGEPLTNEEFELLALRYLDSVHSEEEVLRLSEHLRASPEKRDVFAALSMEIGVLSEMSLSARRGLSEREGKSSRLDGDSQFLAARAKPIIFDDLSEPETPESGKWWNTNLLSYFLGMVVLVTAGVVGWRMLPRDAEELPVAVSSEATEIPTGVRTVRLLDSGTTTLELPNIGTVVVQGPADFELINPMRARLHQGRIKVNITEENGKGFVVETPDGEVTDLGTEFGLEVSDRRSTGLVVFQGVVDLRVAQALPASPLSKPQRLLGGEAVHFSKSGQVDRIMSIMTHDNATFQLLDGAPADDYAEMSPVITNVSDNLRTPSPKKFYQIVLGGIREDALAFVDRPGHEWNGCTEKGMPPYLVGADYVKTFAGDKRQRDMKVEVTLGCPARLFVFFDARVAVPRWLKQDFRYTGDEIGLDVAPASVNGRIINADCTRGVGPGNSVENRFSIWERVVDAPGKVTLGPTAGKSTYTSMYGIAAVPLRDSPQQGEEEKRVERAAVSR